MMNDSQQHECAIVCLRVFGAKFARSVGRNRRRLVVHLPSFEQSQLLRERGHKGVQALITLQGVVESIWQDNADAETSPAAHAQAHLRARITMQGGDVVGAVVPCKQVRVGLEVRPVRAGHDLVRQTCEVANLLVICFDQDAVAGMKNSLS